MVKGCSNELMKFILFVFNFCFVALGVCLMGLGGYVLSQAGKWEGVAPPDAAAILVIVVGAVTFFVAFLGCCGASSESACMLNTYAIIVGLVFILEIAVAILLLVKIDDITREVTKEMDETFKKAAEKDGNVENQVVNAIQSLLECCGTTGKDFWVGSSHEIPPTCCKNPGEDSGTCGVSPNTPFDSGCDESIKEFLNLFASLIAGVLIFAAAIKSVVACFACALSNAVTY